MYQNLICLGSGCAEDSLAGQVNTWRQYPNTSYLATAPMSWLDDYTSWIHTKQSSSDGGISTHCCRYYPGSERFCPHDSEDVCNNCVEDGEPQPEDFSKTIFHFLQQNPGEHCAKAGHGAFADSVKLARKSSVAEVNSSQEYLVTSSNLMAFHTILRTSEDYYTALRRARQLTDSITATINANRSADQQVTVFPYSIFYVFYEQYLTMWTDTLTSVGISLLAIFLVTFLLMGFDLRAATVILLVILMILVDLGAVMFYWDITLNAVSLVNIVMAVGISVEFCSHITRYFTMHGKPDRRANARDAVINMGSSVLSGITLTKFGGICVLAFAKSKIFTVFYFRWDKRFVLKQCNEAN